MGKLLFLALVLSTLISTKAAAQLRLAPVTDTIKIKHNYSVLPQNFYIQHLGFFCKAEIQVQKITLLPLFFRIGTKDYVDRLEQKPGFALKPPSGGL